MSKLSNTSLDLSLDNLLTDAYTVTSNVVTNTGTYTTNTPYIINYPPTTVNYPQTWITDNTSSQNRQLHVKGDSFFDGEVNIQGKNLIEMLERIEDRLAILHPNEKLEQKWDELRDLRKKYLQLEKEILEKESVWNILKK